MSMQTDNQLKISLLWIRATFLSHVIACRLRKVQSSYRNLTDLTILQVNSEMGKEQSEYNSNINLEFDRKPTKLGERVSSNDRIDSVQPELFGLVPPISHHRSASEMI